MSAGMRHVQRVALDRAILHQVEPGESGLRMSGRELPLSGSPRLAGFLAGHIRNALADSQTKAANWAAQGTQSSVAGSCRDLLDDRADLVPASQDLARTLHDAVGNDRRITPGALAIIVFHDDASADQRPERYVALVKLDESEGFRPEWLTDADGTAYLSVTELPDVLPTLHEKLQKCAFVHARTGEDKYDLLVLDRQVPAAPAHFFIQGFLGAELAFDDKMLADRLYHAIAHARNDLQDSLSAEQLSALDDSVRGLFAGERVDLTEWLPTLADQERAAIEQQVRENQLDLAFTIPHVTRERFRTKVRYRGDSGLQVQVDSDAFSELVRVEKVNGASRRWRVTIETSIWEPE
jgi:nucleoid-associated protein YejK